MSQTADNTFPPPFQHVIADLAPPIRHELVHVDDFRHGDAPWFDAFDGTVCEGIGAPTAIVIPESQSSASANCDGSTTAPCDVPIIAASTPHNGFSVNNILRAHRLDELLAAIAEWRRAECIERAYWRSTARWQLAEFRRLHTVPERRAFEAAVAVARSRQHKEATL